MSQQLFGREIGRGAATALLAMVIWSCQTGCRSAGPIGNAAAERPLPQSLPLHRVGYRTLHGRTKLTRQRGGNLILVTHSTKAASIADRTLVMRDGRLALDAPGE